MISDKYVITKDIFLRSFKQQMRYYQCKLVSWHYVCRRKGFSLTVWIMSVIIWSLYQCAFFRAAYKQFYLHKAKEKIYCFTPTLSENMCLDGFFSYYHWRWENVDFTQTKKNWCKTWFLFQAKCHVCLMPKPF